MSKNTFIPKKKPETSSDEDLDYDDQNIEPSEIHDEEYQEYGRDQFYDLYQVANVEEYPFLNPRRLV